jgi:hypothetical protein
MRMIEPWMVVAAGVVLAIAVIIVAIMESRP